MHQRRLSVSWTHRFTIGLGMCLALMGSVAQATDAVLTRKNIDHLTRQELAAYEHAIQILKDRSATNPYDKSGYLWQAWVHNCPFTWVPEDGKPDDRTPACDFWNRGRRNTDPSTPDRKYVGRNPGMCEHGKDLFLPWHRGELYYFEEVLQGADPDGTLTDSRGQTGPSTRNVTVPYWNWTKTPSGKRYPRPFEVPGSPLYHENRAHDPIAPGFSYPFASPYLIAYQLYHLEWPAFGGYERGTRGGYGDFEATSHNPMHDIYMDGDMSSPSTAALDPVFFAFHAYIDLLFEQWIQLHGTDSITSNNMFLRADQPEEIADPPGYRRGAGKPSMGQVKLYLDTRMLGYEYEISPQDRFVSEAELDAVMGTGGDDPPIFGKSARSLFTRLIQGGRYTPDEAPDIVRTIDFVIPAPQQTQAGMPYFAVFDRNTEEPDLSFQMDVYLYPEEAPFDAGSRPFRDRYLAAAPAVHWGSGTVPHHDMPRRLRTNISQALADVIRSGYSGQKWKLTTAVSLLPSLSTFGQPAVEDAGSGR